MYTAYTFGTTHAMGLIVGQPLVRYFSFYEILYGRIISWSSCSTMWQCQTNKPGLSNKALTRVISSG